MKLPEEKIIKENTEVNSYRKIEDPTHADTNTNSELVSIANAKQPLGSSHYGQRNLAAK